MIGFIRGRTALRDDPYLYIDVQGVGYKILASRDVIISGMDNDSEILVYTYTHVKEDALELFGFKDIQDLKLFELFIGISGIGPKTAIQIFSVGSRNEIIQAISQGDVSFFTAVPRLGKKNAQKIILELKSKFSQGGDELAVLDGNSAQGEVQTALLSMGFTNSEIHKALKTAPQEASVDQILKHALKNLGK